MMIRFKQYMENDEGIKPDLVGFFVFEHYFDSADWEGIKDPNKYLLKAKDPVVGKMMKRADSLISGPYYESPNPNMWGGDGVFDSFIYKVNGDRPEVSDILDTINDLDILDEHGFYEFYRCGNDFYIENDGFYRNIKFPTAHVDTMWPVDSSSQEERIVSDSKEALKFVSLWNSDIKRKNSHLIMGDKFGVFEDD